MRESEYQTKVIKKLHDRLPGCVVLKNDCNYLQGILDLTVLCPNGFWAALEVKVSASAPKQPNQEYYVELLDEMSFAAFIFPENEEDVFDDLQRAFESCWSARVSKR